MRGGVREKRIGERVTENGRRDRAREDNGAGKRDWRSRGGGRLRACGTDTEKARETESVSSA